jgi:hypothetical protein
MNQHGVMIDGTVGSSEVEVEDETRTVCGKSNNQSYRVSIRSFFCMAPLEHAKPSLQ